ncbi:MAG: aminotransferase class I/II-fold pyridoxal phosphate-dependent enzyme [Pirellulales bacterium]
MPSVDSRSPSPPSDRTTRDLIREKVENWLRDEAGLPCQGIEADTPLSQLGVDSMGVASISGELERETGKRMNPEVLYELESIDEIANYLDRLKVTAEVEGAAQPPIAQTQIAQAPSVTDSNHHAATTTPNSSTAADSTEASLIAHYEILNRKVRSLKEHGLYFFESEITAHDGSWVVVDGQRMLMLGSYEYLGLLHHPKLKSAMLDAIERFGTGHHGARLLTGTTSLHKQLERKLSEFMRAEDSLVYSSGFVTNVSTVATLVDRTGVVIGDEWNHASIVDGCRASGAEFLTFRHNNIDSLAQQLDRAAGRPTLVVVDAVFSMDGDIIDLPGVVEQCRKHRALLMVDEAHSIGVLGKTGRGIQEHFGLADHDIDIKMGTLSKTIANIGGFVAGRESIITFLRHHARGYIFSGALPNGPVAASIAAIEVMETEPQHVERLWANREYYVAGLKKLGFDIGHTQTPIVPIMTWTEEAVLEMTRICRELRLLVVPVAFPAVPLNATRLRTCVSSSHSFEDLDFALDVLATAGRRTGLIR